MTELDDKGHKMRIKVFLKRKEPMSYEGFQRWGKAKNQISKSKYVWKFYARPPAKIFTDSDGQVTVPVEHFETDQAIINFIFKYFHVSNGDHLAIQGFSHGKTKTRVKFSRHLAEVLIQNVENHKADIIKSGQLERYWFRAEKKRPHRQ